MENLNTPTSGTEEKIRDIVLSVIPEETVYVVELRLRGWEGSRVAEVFLDSDTGISVDDLARFSREIGFLLEASEVIKGKYRLNVSSPGADKPLRLPRQFGKHVGRPLAVETIDGDQVRGVLEAADRDSVTLRKGGDEVRLAFDQIREAKVELPW